MTDIWLDMNICNLNFPSLCLFIEPGDCDREARAGDRRGTGGGILALTAAAGEQLQLCQLAHVPSGHLVFPPPRSVTMSQCVFCFSPHQNNRWAWSWDTKLGLA